MMTAATTAELVITVHGTPAPQGSKRHVGGGRMVESSAKVKPWREAVKWAALTRPEPATLDGPILVEVTFTVRKPTSAPKRLTSWPVTRSSGDIDKLLRATLDALTDAGVMRDDSQVVEVTARKVYPGEGIDALEHPGALIRITSGGTA